MQYNDDWDDKYKFLKRLMAIFDIHILTWSDYLLLWIN